ncbi:YbjQ family protein [Rhodospirillaceae bacterium SYSU D60014]|uniref:YbjQ family protein n=1 Tax=Virgifigura deserti TaxID=2268457 RepID=UPI000E663248
MLTVTTPSIEGKMIETHYGIVSGDAIVGANMFRDVFARVRDVIGGRAGGYEKALRAAKQAALDDMIAETEQLGANAIVGVDLDYEAVGESMLMVSATGTAVRVA